MALDYRHTIGPVFAPGWIPANGEGRLLVHDLILERIETHADHAALIRGDDRLSYSELGREIGRAAAGFASLGLRPGERVAVYLNKRIEGVVAHFAASLCGAVFVPINPVLKAAQVAHILADCSVSVLVTANTQLASISAALENCQALRHVVLVDGSADEKPTHFETTRWDALSGGEPIAPVKRIDNDVAAILYTSGSTGKPKGVVLSHRNLVSGAVSVASYLANSTDDVILSALPLSFDAGFSQLTTAFHAGATVVLLDYLLPRDTAQAVARYRVTGLTGVPPMWNQLARIDWPEEAIASLRYIANTGGAMPTATLETLRHKLPTTTVFLMYGLTEAFRSTYLPPEELDARPTSIGKAIPNAEVMVVRDDGSVCGPGEPGELVHRGALVALGYWNDPERTRQRFRPAPGRPGEVPTEELAVWSGDTVVKDEDGFLYFVARKDDMIKSSGYRISPTEIEEVVYATGLVNECAAIGVPHADIGQAVVVVAHASVPGDGSASEIAAACRRALPNYMVPARVVWREAMPKNPNGKVDRRRLVSDYEDLFEEDTK